MKKRFYRQVVLVLVLSIGLSSFYYYVTCAGLRHCRKGEPGKISYILYDTTHYAVVFSGSSRISRNVDVQLFQSKTGYKTYNAGIDGAGFTTVDWLTREFIKVHGAPRYIYINIDQSSMEMEAEIFYYPMYYPYLNDDETHQMECTDARLRRGRWLPFLAISDIDDYLKGVAAGAWGADHKSGDSVFDRQGFEPIYTSAYKGKDDSVVLSFDYHASNFVKLDGLCAYCESKGSRVFFLMAPIYGVHDIDTFNTRTFYSCIRDIERKYHIPELNYYSDRRFTHNMFFNSTHLNYRGADLYTVLLADTLMALSQPAPID